MKPTWKLSRLETWATPGIPDVLLLDEFNRFHLVELKYCEKNYVSIRPHQVAFLSNHQSGFVWLLVKKEQRYNEDNKLKYSLYVYRGDAVMDVALKGLQTCPFALIEEVEESKMWEKFFKIVTGTPAPAKLCECPS